MTVPARSAVMSAEELRSGEARESLGRMAMAKGVYDLTHLGHIESLWMARELGDSLVVALATDESVRKRKGTGRPILSFRERAGILSSLRMIDCIVPYDESNPYRILMTLRPSLFCATHFDYLQPADLDQLEGLGIELVQLPRPQERSTSDIIRDIRRVV